MHKKGRSLIVNVASSHPCPQLSFGQKPSCRLVVHNPRRDLPSDEAYHPARASVNTMAHGSTSLESTGLLEAPDRKEVQLYKYVEPRGL